MSTHNINFCEDIYQIYIVSRAMDWFSASLIMVSWHECFLFGKYSV